MIPETLFRYCFAAVTGTGFGIIIVLILLAIIAEITGIGGIKAGIERRDK